MLLHREGHTNWMQCRRWGTRHDNYTKKCKLHKRTVHKIWTIPRNEIWHLEFPFHNFTRDKSPYSRLPDMKGILRRISVGIFCRFLSGHESSFFAFMSKEGNKCELTSKVWDFAAFCCHHFIVVTLKTLSLKEQKQSMITAANNHFHTPQNLSNSQPTKDCPANLSPVLTIHTSSKSKTAETFVLHLLTSAPHNVNLTETPLLSTKCMSRFLYSLLLDFDVPVTKSSALCTIPITSVERIWTERENDQCISRCIERRGKQTLQPIQSKPNVYKYCRMTIIPPVATVRPKIEQCKEPSCKSSTTIISSSYLVSVKAARSRAHLVSEGEGVPGSE